ncbi:MAG: metallophosphoesterase family protein [Rikenellaceae bacterium]
MKRIALISDTHGTFDNALKEFARECDEIWHAGDLGGSALDVADQIAAYKPLRCVWGNVDGSHMRLSYQKFESFECEGVRVLMTHIGGYPKRYTPEAKAKIESLRPKIFISGHSHILKVIYDPKYDMLHINPGAAGNFGFHKVRTAIRFTIDGSDIRDLEVGEWQRM